MFFSCRVDLRYPDFHLQAACGADEGDLLTLLGPSGCGKTTLLRTIAGLEGISSGSISLGSRDISALPPERRNIGFVFQDYALFPHLSVFENIAYSPRAKGFSHALIRKTVSEQLELMGLQGYEKRKIHELSGGEQQRIALARALASKPQLLLLDEPLSALDAGTRTELRRKISQIQKTLSITTVYVTHDQQEALAISDKIVLMREGRIIQAGTPEELYGCPETAFAAEFMGTANIFNDGEELLFFRPEHCRLSPEAGPGCYRFHGPVAYREFIGNGYFGEMQDSERKVKVNFFLSSEKPLSPEDEVDIFVSKSDTRKLLDEPQEYLGSADK